MSTRERRQTAISELLDLVTPQTGRVLVYVWALEQASSRRGWDTGSDQDRLVSWVMRKPKGQKPGGTFQRYYHLYKEGELEEDVLAVGGIVVENGYEKDNWWVVCSRPS
jgi:tRNA (uracil-5-)-methyltransferase TRM9